MRLVTKHWPGKDLLLQKVSASRCPIGKFALFFLPDHFPGSHDGADKKKRCTWGFQVLEGHASQLARDRLGEQRDNNRQRNAVLHISCLPPSTHTIALCDSFAFQPADCDADSPFSCTTLSLDYHHDPQSSSLLLLLLLLMWFPGQVGLGPCSTVIFTDCEYVLLQRFSLNEEYIWVGKWA